MDQSPQRFLSRSQLRSIALRHVTLTPPNHGHSFVNTISTSSSSVSSSSTFSLLNSSSFNFGGGVGGGGGGGGGGAIGLTGDVELPDLFFRLINHEDVELYKSEVVTKTLNPIWAPIELNSSSAASSSNSFPYLQTPMHKYTEDDNLGFEIVVYRLTSASTNNIIPSRIDEIEEEDEYDEEDGEDDDNTEGNAKLNALDEDGLAMQGPLTEEPEYFEEELFRFHIQFEELEPLPGDFRELYFLPLNTLILNFESNRYYVQRETMALLVQNGMITNNKRSKDNTPRPVKSQFRFTRAMQMLDQAVELQNQIKQKQLAITRKRQAIEDEIFKQDTASAKENARLQLQERIMELKSLAISKFRNMEQLKTVAKVEKRMLSLDQKLPRALSQLSSFQAKQAEMNHGVLNRRLDILRTAHSIRWAQATLVSQLYDIYPIAYLGAGEYSICGIKFTNADPANGKDEELVSTALGYIAHFVFLLAKYLNVNLRYAIIHLSSRSCMRDDVNDPYGEYPLYKRGSEKERFEKAFLFLKKDVEQLLQARGLDPQQPGQLLFKLTTLVEAEILWLKQNTP